MFLGLEWYWWIAILALLAVSIPFKVKFLNGGISASKERSNTGNGGGGMIEVKDLTFSYGKISRRYTV